jgi:hypothetical protein
MDATLDGSAIRRLTRLSRNQELQLQISKPHMKETQGC